MLRKDDVRTDIFTLACGGVTYALCRVAGVSAHTRRVSHDLTSRSSPEIVVAETPQEGTLGV